MTNNRRPAPDWGTDKEPPKEATSSSWALLCAADIVPQEVNFLWYPYIPAGRLTSIEGDPGVGKSWFTAAVAACVTTGKPFPGEDPKRPRPPGKVLMMSSEDGLADTIVPRLKSLGANLSNVFFPAKRFILDSAGIRGLEATVQDVAAAMVFIDPVQLFIGVKVDINRANEVRGFMDLLHQVAERTGCAIILIRHFNKSGSGTRLYKGLGSIDFAASLRSVLQVELAADEARYVNHEKCNNAKEGDTITYTLKMGQGFQWGKTIPRDAPKVSATPRKRATCREFLRELLSGGKMPAAEAIQAAEAAGFSLSTVKMSKKGIVESVKVGGGKDGEWIWQLIGDEDEKLGVPKASRGRGASDIRDDEPHKRSGDRRTPTPRTRASGTGTASLGVGDDPGDGPRDTDETEGDVGRGGRRGGKAKGEGAPARGKAKRGPKGSGEGQDTRDGDVSEPSTVQPEPARSGPGHSVLPEADLTDDEEFARIVEEAELRMIDSNKHGH